MIEILNITKSFKMGENVLTVLHGVDLTIKAGEYVAIIGPSGSGKSTLMNVIGCLDKPTTGHYRLNQQDVSQLSEKELARQRNKNIGFVFQRFNLLGKISAQRNVELPAQYAGMSLSQRRMLSQRAMEAVGLGDRLDHRPLELSGGQQQRVAIARALVNRPNILLADEPTGALDSKTGKEIMDLFESLQVQNPEMTIILVTHDHDVAARAKRVVSIRDGLIASDITN
ncbi:MAG: ABC transporter ATP-binding protein [Anaerolineae bacterium]|nr:ABC transporter ATP-binding protein [Anaerolineae bacterium]